MAKIQHVYIVGESPLVEEYAALCAGKRLSVAVRLNPGETARLPKGMKKASTPQKSVAFALELTNAPVEIKKKNLHLLDSVLAPAVPIISSSVTVTVAEQSGWIRKPQRLIGIGALPSLLEGSL